MNPMQPIQPLGAQANPQSQYLVDALRQLQSAGAQSQTPSALGMNLGADALLQGQQQKQDYANALRANGIDPTLDPGAGPQSLADKIKGAVGGMFGLGQGQNQPQS